MQKQMPFFLIQHMGICRNDQIQTNQSAFFHKSQNPIPQHSHKVNFVCNKVSLNFVTFFLITLKFSLCQKKKKGE